MNAHTPFDAKQDWTNPYCQNSSNDPMVDALLGNAYHVVRTVYCNLGNLKLLYDFLNQYGMVIGVQSEAELKALTTDAKYARIYGFSRAGDRQVTDYLYVDGDRTGILPDDPEATGSWITVATSGSNGGGTSSGESAYIPWVYANGSATGGETTINVPDDTLGVPFIIVNGDMQYVGRGFEFNVENQSVTLAQPLEEGDEVVFLLTGTPAVPDNPNVSDWIQINWLYNGGYAVGGEQIIAVPYTFQSIPAVYKNGLRLYKGLTTESYTADPDNQRIFLTEPLATNDRLIVQIGGEIQVLEASDHTLQEVARATNVKDSEVILSTDTTQFLNGKKIVYSASEQKAYGLPSLPSNIYISSVSNGQLTYNPGNVTVTLLPTPQEMNTRATPVTWSGFAGGADPTGVNSSTAAFQASLDQVGYINIQPGEYLIDGSLNIAKAAVIFGAGRGLSKVKFSGNASTPLLKILLGHASQAMVCLRDVTFNAAIPNCGPLVSISTDAAAQSATQVVVGDTDKLIISNVDAYGDAAGNYWNCGVEAIDCGGLSINGFTFNNKTTSAQTNTTTAGFRLKTTDPKVSVIRAITANNFYILRANYGLETAPISNTKGGITSYYLSDFEIVGVKNGIKAQNWCAAWRVTGHIDSTEQCLNFQSAALTNARFAACDFRKGNNGGLGYVAGPMVTLDYGEQITFSGSTFSGINLNLADPSNVVFSFTNVYNGSYMFLMSVLGNTFTKFQNVLGQTNGASNIVIGPNAYNQIADAITFDSNLDSSFNLHTPVSSLSKTVALPVGDSSFTVDLVANRFKNAPNYADARPVNNTAQAVRVVYDYAASTASLLTFRVYGVTTAATFRFGITTA